MARYERNRVFLESFCNRQDRKIKQVLQNANQEEIKTVSELFINIDSFVVTEKDRSKFKKFKKIICAFLKKRWTIPQLKKFFIKHSRLVSIIVVSFLAKFVEGVVCQDLLRHV